jgi:glyoxylase-like metal-dependent hydrolase (beta-lactamase superfamily II)
MNTYGIIDPVTSSSAIIDPGGNPEIILDMLVDTKIEKILITHGHHDHVMALEEVHAATHAPVYIHPLDAKRFSIGFDQPLEHDQSIQLGNLKLAVIHVPGHTPGQCCFDLCDGRILVGDAIFVGGPGRTESFQDFLTTMKSMQDIVFNWPDDTLFYPGHGLAGEIGIERLDFERFLKNGWPDDLFGDITWK